MILSKEDLGKVLDREIKNVRAIDLHTHLYSRDFNDLVLWGIDELLTNHYIVEEYFRYSTLSYNEFFTLSKKEQADLVWKTLFIEHSPVSQAQKEILAILNKLNIDISTKALEPIRTVFKNVNLKEHIDNIFEICKLKEVVMTNDPFKEKDREAWGKSGNNDSRFKSALWLDTLLNNYKESYKKLKTLGYEVNSRLDEKSLKEVKRFLREWIKKINALYIVSYMPPEFFLPDSYQREKLIKDCVMPVCREYKIPFAMTIGIRRGVNEGLKEGGYSIGRARIEAVEYMCKSYPNNKFMVTMLSRENQHELAVASRKFRNLFIFGCWNFLSNSSLIEEITRTRMETVGLSFIPQYSNAEVLEQLIYKWDYSRKIVSRVLFERYRDIFDLGWKISEDEIRRDVEDLFANNFTNFLKI